MVAFSLFCVTTRGFESNFPTPLASAAVMKKSTAKLGERCTKPKPLVGAPAPRLVLSGIPLAGPPVEPAGTATPGGAGNPGLPVAGPGLMPTCGAPLNNERPPVVEPAKPSSVP